MIYSEHYKHAKSNHILLMNNSMKMFVDLEEPKKYNNPDILLVWFMKEDKISNYSWVNLIQHIFPEYAWSNNMNEKIRW